MKSAITPMLDVDGRCTGLPARRATGFWSRAAGLWATSACGVPHALELRPCAAVHTLGMRGPIDVVFVAADGTVLRAVAGLAPWRVAMLPRAVATWELPPGTCAAHGVRRGTRLQVSFRIAAERCAGLPEAGSGRRRAYGP
jgi:uncharacterized membrane protein (UPF0127 family)